MSRPGSSHPTELELLILKILWERSPQTVRETRDELEQQGRGLAHTSVITTLGTMVEKGQLRKLDPIEGKAFRFEPILAQDKVSREMLGDLVNRIFDGSAEAVMLSLFEVSDLDDEEIKQMRRLFNRKVREKK